MQLDSSYPRESAERRLKVKSGRLTLDELAMRLSIIEPDDPLSVRDINTKPIKHSKVYFKGEATPDAPYLTRFS